MALYKRILCLLLPLVLIGLSVNAQVTPVRPPKRNTTSTPKPKPTPRPTPTPKSKTKPSHAPRPKPDPNAGKVSIANKIAGNMVRVQGGTFRMGATSEQEGDAWNDELPVHEVTLSTFSICRYEVTQREWKAIMGTNPSTNKGDDLPVENVSWDDCQAFIKKLNTFSSHKFRLPTEAEWEYAARGGNQSRGYKFAGSDDINSVAHYNDGIGTEQVGQKMSNELGLYDMSGNVWEWCQDWYTPYSSSPENNPKGPTAGSMRIVRGGCWCAPEDQCRVSTRASDLPNTKSSKRGLRLAW